MHGFHGLHGGYGWGQQNPEGKRVLELADSLDRVVENIHNNYFQV